jgi:hypothetical protein
VHPILKTFLNYSTSLQTISLYGVDDTYNVADVLGELVSTIDFIGMQDGADVLVRLIDRTDESISVILTLVVNDMRICLNEYITAAGLSIANDLALIQK